MTGEMIAARLSAACSTQLRRTARPVRYTHRAEPPCRPLALHQSGALVRRSQHAACRIRSGTLFDSGEGRIVRRAQTSPVVRRTTRLASIVVGFGALTVGCGHADERPEAGNATTPSVSPASTSAVTT